MDFNNFLTSKLIGLTPEQFPFTVKLFKPGGEVVFTQRIELPEQPGELTVLHIPGNWGFPVGVRLEFADETVEVLDSPAPKPAPPPVPAPPKLRPIEEIVAMRQRLAHALTHHDPPPEVERALQQIVDLLDWVLGDNSQFEDVAETFRAIEQHRDAARKARNN